jgi:hypothetical protein
LLLGGKEKIDSNECDRTPGTQETAVTMATSKHPNKGEDEENASSEPQQKLLFDFYKRKKHGRPKKCANLVTDKVEVIRKRPKKQPTHVTTSKAPPKGLPQLLFANWTMEITISQGPTGH